MTRIWEEARLQGTRPLVEMQSLGQYLLSLLWAGHPMGITNHSWRRAVN